VENDGETGGNDVDLRQMTGAELSGHLARLRA